MIPISVTNIGIFPCDGCTYLTAITVNTTNPAYCSVAGVLFNKSQTMLVEYPGGLVGNYTISNCVTSIGVGAFADCPGLTSVIISNSVTNIEVAAFYSCGLTNVTIPDTVTSVGIDTFTDCTNLTSVTIPGSVTDIGSFAFYGCSRLSSITIPNSVTNIEDAGFAYCTSLTNIYFLGNASSLGASVFSHDSVATVYYIPGTTGWGATFGGLPTALWFLPNPLILNNSPSFGVQSNRFSFIISWATKEALI
jgi:hypothetical protein